MFGRGYEVIHDGPDPKRLMSLTGEAKTRAKQMLRRGIQACDIFAPEAVEGAGWHDLIPDLTRAATANHANFRARVILALKRLGSTQDFTDQFVEVLSAGSEEARITAAMGARLFSLDRFRAPLLERMRRDPAWLVRTHAANSLLELADIYPRALNDHAAIATALVDPAQFTAPPLLEVFGLHRAPSKEELARFADAAERMDAAITARLAAGPCSKPAALTMVDLYLVRLSEHVLALAVEESIGSCERNLAFVAFLRSPGGFGQWLASGVESRDPLKSSIETLPKRVIVSYRRADRVLTIGAVALDTTKANVAVFSVDTNGVANRYQTTQRLSFARSGRPPPFEMDVLRFKPEVAASVRAIMDRSPQIRGLIQD